MNEIGRQMRGGLRWAGRVAATGALAGALVALGAPGAVALLAASALAVWGVARTVAAIVAATYQETALERRRRLARAGRHRSDELVDELTHDPFRAAGQVLRRARSRPGSRATVEAALAQLDAIDARLRSTSAARRATPDAVGPGALYGGVAYDKKDAIAMKLYGDPLNLPGWLTPALRDLALRIGRVLDDVRLLHNLQVEWAVMLFTLWARALLIVLAPLLASLTFTTVPLAGGFSVADVPWLLASAWAAGCALAAPAVARVVMERTPRGTRLRGLLLAVELPLVCACALTAPAWMVVAFASGWTNWWQRQWGAQEQPAQFSWARLGVFLLVTVVTQAIGLALDGVGAGPALVEVLVTLATIAVIGGSYGAMLPVSASVLVQALVGAAGQRRRAARSAAAEVDRSIAALLAAADALSREAGPGSEAAREDAAALRDVVRQLQLREDLAERARWRTPTLVESLLEDALRSSGRMEESAQAQRLLAQAAVEGRPAPVVFAAPAVSPASLRTAHIASRAHARALRRIVVRCAVEGRVHGTGSLQTTLRLEGDRLVLRIANQPSPTPAGPGRRRGREELEALVRQLPGGTLRHRGLVDSRFVDGRGNYDVYGVEIGFDRSVLRERDLGRMAA